MKAYYYSHITWGGFLTYTDLMNKRQKPVYTDEEQAEFCNLAQELGIGRAIRELGYPMSWATGYNWMQARNIKPNINKAMQAAKQWHVFYEVEDLMEKVDTAVGVVEEMLLKVDTADDMKKLSEALQKLVNTRLLLEGKATTITEKREVTQQDLEIQELIRAERAKQNDVTSQDLDTTV